MDAVFLKILNMSLTANWIVLAVLLLRLLLKRAPKWVSCLLWGVVGLRLIFPFSIESLFSLIPSAEPLPSDLPMTQTPAIDSGFEVIDRVVNPIIYDSFAPTPTVSVNPMQIVITVAAIVWLCGLVGMIAYGVISYLRLRLRVRASIRQDGNVYLCDDIDSPFILGVIRPRIYLPSGMTQEQMGYVIGHERAHLRRLDHIWKPLGFALLCLHWFNPLLWVAYILLCRDIEKACDEKVIRDMDDESKKGYSETLVVCSVHRRTVMACPLAFGEVGVKDRIKSVLNYKKPAFWIILVAVVALVVTGVCFLTDPINKEPQEPEYINSGTTADGVNWFVGTILEISESSFLVEPAEGTPERKSADKITVSRATSNDEDDLVMPYLRSGEEIYVYYTGGIAESYPAQINKVRMIVPKWATVARQPEGSVLYDIDNDGQKEYCVIGYGPEEDGKYVVCISAWNKDATALEYSNYYLSQHIDSCLILHSDGTLWVGGAPTLGMGKDPYYTNKPSFGEIPRRIIVADGKMQVTFPYAYLNNMTYDEVVAEFGEPTREPGHIEGADITINIYEFPFNEEWNLRIDFIQRIIDIGVKTQYVYHYSLTPKDWIK